MSSLVTDFPCSLLVSNFPCSNATANQSYKCNPINIFTQIWSITFVLILISTSSINGFAAAAAAAERVRLSENSVRNIPSHYNFLKGRHRVFSCANDRNSCLDPEKNPWGGTTCCFQKFCKDTRSDPRHCGGCGRTCAFGLICCDGRCVDIQKDPQHCGSCFEDCPGQNKCSFAMCDYG